MTVELNETAAAEAEGFAPISKDALALQRRYHVLANRMKPLKVEQDAIKALLTEEMTKQGVSGLTYKGVPVVTIDKVNNKDINWDGILVAFPEAVKFIGTKITKRFNAKTKA